MVRGTISGLYGDEPETPPLKGDKAPKRRCVQSACIPCRKRKSKCDGGTPVCATCTAVYKTNCHYDAESDSRRSKSALPDKATIGIKREASNIVTSSLHSQDEFNAQFIVSSLRKLPDEHVLDFVQHIRKDPEAKLATLAETWHKTVTLSFNAPLEPPSLETDLSVLLGKPAVTLTGESRHFGHSAGLGLVPEDENFLGSRVRTYGTLPEQQGTTWTTVTNDLEFVNRLLKLYFTWSHSFYILFSRECFYRDFESGRDKYCSPLLVNAICAFACHFTTEPAARTDPSDFRTAGDHFFAEAKRLLYEDDETPSLTTTQALCIMAMREPSTGRDSTGFRYMGRCMRMCVELGLHLNNNASPVLNLTPSEIEVRKVTFWGCFTMDTIYSVCTGRISQLPRAAITLDKSIMKETVSYSEALGVSSTPNSCDTTATMFLQEFSSLSELINDNNFMYFAPQERLTSSKLQNCYEKYQAWYQQLPPELSLKDNDRPEPQILVLHMLYFTMIVHLFRPMLKVNLIHSDVRPRDICIDAANTVSNIARIYRSLYDFRFAHLVIPHILLNVCIVHLLYSKDNHVSRENLSEGLRGLEDLHECHYFGARSFRIIHSLSQHWNLPFPEEHRDSKLILTRNAGHCNANSLPTDPLLVAPKTMPTTAHKHGITIPYSPHDHNLNRRDSLSMFEQSRLSLAQHSVPSRRSSVTTTRHLQSPATDHVSMQSYSAPISLASFSYSQTMSTATVDTVSTSNISPVSSSAVESLFWTPIPGLPGPILPRNNYQQPGSIGLESLVRSSDMGERLGRDGFEMNDEWRRSQVNEYHTGTEDGVFGTIVTNQQTGYTANRNECTQSSDAVAYAPSGQHDHQDYVAGWWQPPHSNSGSIS